LLIVKAVSRRAKVWIALWTVYIIWGSTYLGIELAVETIPPVFAVGVRFLIAGTAMAAWVAWRRGARRLLVNRRELTGAILVGLLLPGANAVLFIAEQDVPTGLASLIIAAVPLWVVVLRVALRERPDLLALGGVVLGFVGVAVLVRPGGHGATLGGLLLVVLSSVMWAVGSFVSARIPIPRDAFAATTLEMLTGGIALLPIGLLAYSPSDLDPAGYSARSIIGFWYLVVFGSLIGYTAYAWLLANAPIGQVSTYAYVNPVIAIALGAAVLDESITWQIVVGAVVILASVALVVRRESPRELAAEGESLAGAAAPPAAADRTSA
jgi:drug/metabolite transporter (DMT)-like permease